MDMKEVIQAVKDGNKNALEVFIELKRSEKEIANAIKEIKDLAYDEAAKHGEKVFTHSGAEVTMKSGGGRWEYKHLDWWKSFKDKEEQAKLANKSTDVIVDSETGEVIQPAVFKANAETISIKL